MTREEFTRRVEVRASRQGAKVGEGNLAEMTDRRRAIAMAMRPLTCNPNDAVDMADALLVALGELDGEKSEP